MRIALVHDWLTGMRGGEYVLEAIADLFPGAELFTLLALPDKVSPSLTALPVHTSWLQKVPGAERKYRHFLPLMPWAIESFDFRGYDLIISSSHCVAKGVRKPERAVHISYVHAPMRYIWDRFDDYFGEGRSSLWVRLAVLAGRKRLQDWDRRSSTRERVDLLIANSRFIASQIRAVYQRTAHVIHPFVDLERFKVGTEERRNYLMVGAFAPYKRVDLAIDAFNRLQLPLLIVGSGQDETKLKDQAGPTIQFLGALSNAAIEDLLAQSKALIFPGKEDFGITPLEAMASGTPVMAFGEGGVLDSVTGETGHFFDTQSVDSLAEAVSAFERGEMDFDPMACRARAEEFSRKTFQERFSSVVRQAWSTAGKDEVELDQSMHL